MVKHLALCAVITLCAGHGLATAGNGTKLTNQIADTTQVMLVINVAESRDSALIQSTYKKLLANKPDVEGQLTQIGIDPLKDLDTVVFAGGGVTELSQFGDKGTMMIIVEGRFPKKALDQMKGTDSTHQGIAIKTKDDTEAALVKGRLFFTKAGQMQNAIDIALGKGSGKGKNAASSKTAKPLRDTIAKADTKSDLWMVVSVPDADRKNFSQNGLAVEFVTAGMNFTADVAISLKIGSDSPASAEKTVNLLNTLMPQVKTQLNTMGLSKAATSLAVAQDKAIVKATAVLTGAEIGTLTNLVGMMSSAGAGTPPPSTTKPVPSSGGSGLGGSKSAPPKTTPAPAPAKKP